MLLAAPTCSHTSAWRPLASSYHTHTCKHAPPSLSICCPCLLLRLLRLLRRLLLLLLLLLLSMEFHDGGGDAGCAFGPSPTMRQLVAVYGNRCHTMPAMMQRRLGPQLGTQRFTLPKTSTSYPGRTCAQKAGTRRLYTRSITK